MMHSFILGAEFILSPDSFCSESNGDSSLTSNHFQFLVDEISHVSKFEITFITDIYEDTRCILYTYTHIHFFPFGIEPKQFKWFAKNTIKKKKRVIIYNSHLTVLLITYNFINETVILSEPKPSKTIIRSCKSDGHY